MEQGISLGQQGNCSSAFGKAEPGENNLHEITHDSKKEARSILLGRKVPCQINFDGSLAALGQETCPAAARLLSI